MELGLGIHGEPGAEQCNITSADELVERMMDVILGSNSNLAGQVGAGARVAVLVNNLGATTSMELMLATRHVLTYLSGAEPW